MTPNEIGIIKSWCNRHPFVTGCFAVGLFLAVVFGICVGGMTDYNGWDWQGDQGLTAFLVCFVPGSIPGVLWAFNELTLKGRERTGLTREARQEREWERERLEREQAQKVIDQARTITRLERELLEAA